MRTSRSRCSFVISASTNFTILVLSATHSGELHRLWKKGRRTGEEWSRVYYRCRGSAATGHPGCRRGVREDDLLAWGGALMAFLEGRNDQREAVAEALAAAADSPPYCSPDAASRIDAQLERVG